MSTEINENERYARADVQGGYIYNKSEIDYFKQTQAVDVMSNLMLGDFNKKGAYVINKGIIDELVKVRKIYQYSFGSTTFCQSAKDIGGYGKIDFAIKMRNNSQNKTVTATLQLLETIDRANGYYQNTNTVSIATYTAPESNTYIVDMLKYFNVVSKKEDGLLNKEQKEEDVDLIIARKKFEQLLKNNSLDKLEAINKNLYEKRIKLLSKSEVGKKILAQLNSETYKINGWFVKEGMPGYYRYLNQVLDGLLEVHSADVLQDVALTAGLRKTSEFAAVEMAKAMVVTNKMMFGNVNQAENEKAAQQYTLANQNKEQEVRKAETPEKALAQNKSTQERKKEEVYKVEQIKPDNNEKLVNENKEMQKSVTSTPNVKHAGKVLKEKFVDDLSGVSEEFKGDTEVNELEDMNL